MSREIKTNKRGVRYFEVPAEEIGTAMFVVDCKELPPGMIGVNVCGENDQLPEEYYDPLNAMLFQLKDGKYVVKPDPVQGTIAGEFNMISR